MRQEEETTVDGWISAKTENMGENRSKDIHSKTYIVLKKIFYIKKCIRGTEILRFQVLCASLPIIH